MGAGRIPGPFGLGPRFGCVLVPAPFGAQPGAAGPTSPLHPGPAGTADDPPEATPEAAEKQEEQDEKELELLVKVYGVVKNRAADRSYVYWKNKKRHYRVKEYVKDRNDFFGSAEAYRKQLEEARAELDANDEKLRKYVEPPLKERKNLPNWKRAQDVFYAWVRKAYQNKLGEKVDIPKLIQAQMSERLKAALKQVKIDYGESFRHGGFNPRPMKLKGYRLGTISEHAVGNAIDIEASKNPHIPTKTWKAILKFTGKSLDGAKTKWKSSPKALYDAIAEIDAAFVSKLAAAIKEAENATAKAAQAPGAGEGEKAKAAAAKADPLAAAIERSADLKAIGESFLRRWKNGFFNLPWELVKELHEEGFLWGGTFSHPDLHHFELPEKP